MNQPAQTPAEKSIARDVAIRAKLAIENDRPLFLIVYYEHEAVKLAFLQLLQAEVKDVRLTTQTFDPAQRPEHGKGALYPLLSAAAGEKIIALIATLPRLSQGTALDSFFLEYLNLHRDQIARDKLRFVLFLHSSDANQFIEGAGDLWDFRQHTYWLEGKPQAASKRPLVRLSEGSLSEIALSDDARKDVEKHVRSVSLLIEKTADLEEKTQLYLDLSRWLNRRLSIRLAAEAAMEGLDIIPTPGSILHAGLEHELGYALRKMGNPSDALAHYQRSLRIIREIGDRSGEAVTLNNISQIYDDWGRYDEALNMLEESLAIRREIGDRSGEAVTLNNISQIYDAWGRYDEALKMLEESLAISCEIGDRSGEAVTLNNISQIYDAWGRYDEALKKLEESLGIYRQIGNRSGEAATLNNISQIYAAWGRYDEALKKLKESLVIRREIGDRSGEAVTCWNLAMEFERRGDLQSAIKYASCTVEIDEETKHPDLEQDRAYLKSLQEKLTDMKKAGE